MMFKWYNKWRNPQECSCQQEYHANHSVTSEIWSNSMMTDQDHFQGRWGHPFCSSHQWSSSNVLRGLKNRIGFNTFCKVSQVKLDSESIRRSWNFTLFGYHAGRDGGVRCLMQHWVLEKFPPFQNCNFVRHSCTFSQRWWMFRKVIYKRFHWICTNWGIFMVILLCKNIFWTPWKHYQPQHIHGGPKWSHAAVDAEKAVSALRDWKKKGSMEWSHQQVGKFSAEPICTANAGTCTPARSPWPTACIRPM